MERGGWVGRVGARESRSSHAQRAEREPRQDLSLSLSLSLALSPTRARRRRTLLLFKSSGGGAICVGRACVTFPVFFFLWDRGGEKKRNVSGGEKRGLQCALSLPLPSPLSFLFTPPLSRFARWPQSSIPSPRFLCSSFFRQGGARAHATPTPHKLPGIHPSPRVPPSASRGACIHHAQLPARAWCVLCFFEREGRERAGGIGCARAGARREKRRQRERERRGRRPAGEGGTRTGTIRPIPRWAG